MTLKAGDRAPDFELKDADGRETTLFELLKEKAVVVFFYPKNDTAVCTAEACHFRDAYESFLSAGAEVVGISADSEDSDASFASKHRLPYRLVSDGDGKIAAAFEVKKSLFGLVPGRVTFVVGQDGVVKRAFSSQLGAKKHVDEAIAALAADA